MNGKKTKTQIKQYKNSQAHHMIMSPSGWTMVHRGKKASQNVFRGRTGQSYEVDGHCPAFSFPFLILTPLRQRLPMLQLREDEEAMVRESISKHRSGTAAESRRSRAIILPDSEDRLG